MFVSGLPLDVTKEEIAQVFKKCGIFLLDTEGKPKIKLYHDQEGNFQGTALITFFKQESVDLAIRLLDDSTFRYGDSTKIQVQQVCISLFINE